MTNIFRVFSLYLLSFCVPETHLQAVKNAIFATGAGTVDNYKQCSWQTLGEGQFMPLSGSRAFIGGVNQLEKVAEYKVEIVCTEEQIKAAVAALRKAHPYESPYYQAIHFETFW
jgi:structural toxin protein (hemagglutinin/hemolysin) RtxA